LGILLAYGFVSPLAASMTATFNANAKYMQCIRTGLLAHLSGYAPAVSVEFARKTLMAKDRPSFFEVEEAVAALPSV
jgi:chemotaxis protein MotA